MTITAAELAVKVTADTSAAESGLKSFSGKMDSMAGQMAGVGGVLSATIGAPLIGIGVSAIKTAAGFERSMNVLGYASNATGDQMQAMSDLALQLGADTVFSANEAAEGMVDLAKAGMDTQEVMDSIPGVMDLAAAGAISVSDAATLTAATLNTFGLDAAESAKVADVLAAAANASAADISDLAYGVQNAGSVFATNGQSVETLATMMALLANNGLNASDAATSLKTMTMRLTAPTAAASKVMKQLGINVFNADGSMRDYHDIIGDIASAAKGMSDAQRDAAFNTLFGADAIRAANIMAEEGTAGYEAMKTAVEEQGAASEMANAQNSGLAGAMEQISGSIDSLMTKLALPFLDTISGWMGGLTDFVNQLGDLPQPVINASLAFLGFAAAVGAVLLAAAGIATVIGALATPIGLVALVVLGLAAAVAALWLAWETNWGNIQGKTAAVLAVIQPLIETLSSTLSGIGTSLSTFKMPTLTDLGKLKSDIEFQIKATVETLLDPPKLTIMPFPDMTIDPPKVTIKPIPQAAITEAAKGPGLMIDNLTQTIAGGNWAGAGRLMGTLIIARWNTEIAKIEPFITFIEIAGAFSQAILGLQGAMLVALIGFSLALEGTGLPAKIAALGEAIATAVTTMWTNLMATVMGAFIAPAPDNTSTSDTLRDRAAASSFKWSDYIQPLVWTSFVPDFVWSIFVTPLDWVLWIANLTWSTFVSALEWASWISTFDWGSFISGLSWPSFITSLSWGTFISSLSWATFISSLSWSSFIPEMSWANFIPHIDWGRFIPAFSPPSVSPDGPQQDNLQKKKDDATIGFVTAGASFATASYGGGRGNGGPTIVIQNVNVHNDMDIEVLAGKLARRFQQKLR